MVGFDFARQDAINIIGSRIVLVADNTLQVDIYIVPDAGIMNDIATTIVFIGAIDVRTRRWLSIYNLYI